MTKAWRVRLAIAVFGTLYLVATPQVFASSGFGTVTGSVCDGQGNPVAGAAIYLFLDGGNKVVKVFRTGSDGTYLARVAPGRYTLRALADGFNEALFPSVDVHASDRLVYRFNLEPVGSGKTAAERRHDRDDPRWRVRAARERRSIFQEQEGNDQTIRAALGIEEAGEPSSEAATELGYAEPDRKRLPTVGIVETYVASASGLASPYAGLNFALAVPANGHLSLLFDGQTGSTGAPQRMNVTAILRANKEHTLRMSLGGGFRPSLAQSNGAAAPPLGELAMRAVDEWKVRDGVVVVLGFDYARFLGSSGAASISPRIGVQYDANGRTRLKMAYAPGEKRQAPLSVTSMDEISRVIFRPADVDPVAFVDGKAAVERSRRFELGVERVLDNSSTIEATAFFDAISGRGVGLLNSPVSAFSGSSAEAMNSVADQEGSARGLRVVYSRRLNRVWTASAGYSFGRGQRLSGEPTANPSQIFTNAFFQTGALQLDADPRPGTRISTVFRFSPDATVFAIDPFAGRLAVYDPSLSILVTQELPSFGLPLRVEAVLDARNLLDLQPNAEKGESLLLANSNRRSIRGGISVRF